MHGEWSIWGIMIVMGRTNENQHGREGSHIPRWNGSEADMLDRLGWDAGAGYGQVSRDGQAVATHADELNSTGAEAKA